VTVLGRNVLGPNVMGRTGLAAVGATDLTAGGRLGRLAVATSMLVLALGCAGGTAEPPPGSDQAQDAPDKTITVRISDRKVEGVPARVEVDRGNRVRIDVTSDRRDELHVHGYDKTLPLAPGAPATLQFVAEVPGVFEVETHDGHLLLFQLVVHG
jgi:hypothetical protein